MCEESIQKSEEKNNKMEEKNIIFVNELETQKEHLKKQNEKLVDRITKINTADWENKCTDNFKRL